MKVFIAGPRAINELDKNITQKIENICKKNYDIIVGDADGIDSEVQKFLSYKNYKNVTIFASNGIARNNYGNWKVEKVIVKSNKRGFEFYAEKDKKMAQEADIGFMIWNGKSKGTFNNILNLLEIRKSVVVYLNETQQFSKVESTEDLNNFLSENVHLSSNLKKILENRYEVKYVQSCLF